MTGSTLTLDDVMAVARQGAGVGLHPQVTARMEAARRVVESALARNEPVYGLTTGVAELKRVRLSPAELAGFNSELIRSHRMGQGPALAPEIVRAAMLRLLNGLASGYPGVRPTLADVLLTALNDGAAPEVRSLGSLGQADLAQNADLATALFSTVPLAPGEALALLDHNAFSTGAAALAVADARQLSKVLALSGALSLEAFGANLSIIDPLVAESRPYPGLRRAVELLTGLLNGSALWTAGVARNLQDPLTFRNLPQILGALFDALDFATAQLAVELNASNGNPIVSVTEQRVLSVGNFEVLPLAASLDFARIALVPALTSAAERTAKLLATPWSGLPTGLNPQPGPGLGMAELAVAQVSLAAEAALLANPVSTQVVSTSLAEGIEDRITMAPLSASRLADMVRIGRRIVAIEMVVAAQAAELRELKRLGAGTSAALRRLREQVPFLRTDADFPADLEPVVALVASLDVEAIARPVASSAAQA